MFAHSTAANVPFGLARPALPSAFLPQIYEPWRSRAAPSPAHKLILALGSLAFIVHRIMEVPAQLENYLPALEVAREVRGSFDSPTAATAAAEYVQQLGRPAGLSSLLTAGQLQETCLLAEWEVANVMLTKVQQLPAS